ncbi:hypothetical protein ACHHYP_00167 [Achlya hypogyna]|uniref:Probable RNA polymerase II nuclear localization protein SLC7A6OS n=1 Tax=Achlya hypogyna TaxID=1202772 RepID=A0A1V9ZB65_ACHHY|nr:hypothetical protein ACHHYP_00167 [Achlya hypogyna]
MAEQRVLLRVKRKRTDDPVERLVVHSHQQVHLKKSKLEDALGGLSLKPDYANDSPNPADNPAGTDAKPVSVILFTRIDTVSNTTDDKMRARLAKTVQQHHQTRMKKTTTPLETRSSVALQRKDKRSERISKGRGLNLVDVALPSSEAVAPAGPAIAVNGAELRAKALKRVMNPMERQVDEAIWTAFQKNDFSAFFRLQQQQVKATTLNPLLFQRPADGGSILMAAAMHNRTDVIEALLAIDSKHVVLRDYNGKSAGDIAADQGHAAAATALRACETVEDDKQYVYDVYSVDVSATKSLPAPAELDDVPVVEVSTSVEKWLMYETQGDMDSPDRELLFDVSDSDKDDMHEDDEDSNDEGYVANDYPDEESSDEELDEGMASDASDEWQAAWQRSNRHADGSSDPWTAHRADYEADGDY